MTREVKPLDLVKDSACDRCGCTVWIVDTDGAGNFWLLCMDTLKVSCVNTKPIPEDMTIEAKRLSDSA